MKQTTRITKDRKEAGLQKRHTRREAIKLGVLVLGVALPAIITLAPTEARAQSSSP